MKRDFDDLCTWMYVLIGDLFASIGPLLVRPGPPPRLYGRRADHDARAPSYRFGRGHCDISPRLKPGASTG